MLLIMNQISIKSKEGIIRSELPLERLWREEEFLKTDAPTRNFRVTLKGTAAAPVEYYSLIAENREEAVKQVQHLVSLILKEKNVVRVAYNLEGSNEWHFAVNPRYKNMSSKHTVLGSLKKKVKDAVVKLFELEDED